MKTIRLQHPVLLCTILLAMVSCQQEAPSEYVKLVDPMIGTAFNGHTFPGAILPFGMIAASPDTDIEGWAHCSGYHYDDTSIMGFSQTHVSGTGAADMCDLMLMPVTGDPSFEPGTPADPDQGYRSRFSHASEQARPGYYAVDLDDYGIRCEVTVTERCAVYRFTYPEDRPAGIIFDMTHGNADVTLESHLEQVGASAVTGYRRSKGFVRDHGYHFWAELSEPVTRTEARGDSILYAAVPSGRTLILKLGMSTVSAEGARANLSKEVGRSTFDQISARAMQRWNKALSAIEADCLDEEHAKIFYTALYHSLIMPNLITDTDGRYCGWDGEIHRVTGQKDLYTNYSLWDTYRALHPFFNLICPEMNVKFINSWLERYRQIGQLPINEYGICETFCMIGYHAVPVIADAVIQGLDGFDVRLAYEAMKQVAEDPLRGVGLYKQYGYIPSGMEGNAVSKTLEYAYDDWCIAQVARKLGCDDEADYYTKRALYYRNLYDPQTRFLRGKLADGSWNEPFNPLQTSALNRKDYTEGNAWQYTFYVPQDMTSYVSMVGGDDAFEARLDEMFSTNFTGAETIVADVTGLIGQYAHGNEPSHHAAYLYNFAGCPWKTQKLVSRIKEELYKNAPDGLCGNDDCGQISSWYILSSLGFYPVTPAAGYLVIGSPSVREATVHVRNGKKLHITTENVSERNVYIQSVTVDGQPWTRSFLPVDVLNRGAEIHFVMGPEPNPAWGRSPEDRPVSYAFPSRPALRFNSTGHFKILQLTDTHICWDQKDEYTDALEQERRLLDLENPDLVVYTGDVVTGLNADSAWVDFLRPCDERQQPFAVLMGNHDREQNLTEPQIAAQVLAHPMSVNSARNGYLDDWVLEVCSPSGGETEALLYGLDSGDYTQTPGVHSTYGWIRPDQIDWYRRTSRRYTEAYGGVPLPALAFFHIPLLEYGEGRIISGTRGENECPGLLNTGMFAAFVEGGDVHATFAGHDHSNDYIVEKNGIYLAYGRFSGRNTTYHSLPFGARVIELTQGDYGLRTWVREWPDGLVQLDTLPVHTGWRLLPAVTAKAQAHGLTRTTYRGDFTVATDIVAGECVETVTVPGPYMPRRLDPTPHGYVFTGKLWVPETGVRYFHVTGYDCASLTLDDWTIEGRKRFQGAVNLEKGYHDFRVVLANREELERMRIQWRRPSEDRYRDIPDGNFFVE